MQKFLFIISVLGISVFGILGGLSASAFALPANKEINISCDAVTSRTSTAHANIPQEIPEKTFSLPAKDRRGANRQLTESFDFGDGYSIRFKVDLLEQASAFVPGKDIIALQAIFIRTDENGVRKVLGVEDAVSESAGSPLEVEELKKLDSNFVRLEIQNSELWSFKVNMAGAVSNQDVVIKKLMPEMTPTRASIRCWIPK